MKSLEPIEVKMGPKEFIKKIEEENPVGDPWEPDEDFKTPKGEKFNNKTHKSKSDPDAQIAKKSNTGSNLCHSAHYLMDNRNRIIIGVKADKPDRKTEQLAALNLIREAKWKFGINPETVGADKGYGTGEFIMEMIKENIIPHIPISDNRKVREKGIIPLKHFSYDADSNEYMCPEGKRLKYHGPHFSHQRRTWRANKKDCKSCGLKEQCTKDISRTVSIHFYQDQIDFAKEQYKTKAYRISQRKRKLIEGLFGEAKDYMGLREAKFRRLWNVAEQFLLTATAQNIKKMAKLLGKGRKTAEAGRKMIKNLLENSEQLIEKILFPVWENAENFYA
jgi:hypothetical protein